LKHKKTNKILFDCQFINKDKNEEERTQKRTLMNTNINSRPVTQQPIGSHSTLSV